MHIFENQLSIYLNDSQLPIAVSEVLHQNAVFNPTKLSSPLPTTVHDSHRQCHAPATDGQGLSLMLKNAVSKNP